MLNSIKIGTRKSKLALIQTNLVIQKINRHFPNINCEIVPITTSGDLIQSKPLYDIGGKALFLKEIEQALLDKKIDLAVHSLKDVPGIIPEDLSIAAVLEQEDSRDVFVCMTHKSIEELPQNAVIGTSSVRRKLCVQRIRSDLEIVMFRGNVDSRINKLINKEVDATVLAYAGLKRLNAFAPQFCHLIEHSQMLPCIGQGVIGIEARKNDDSMLEICKHINHLPTFQLIKPGRAFLEYLDANCRTPIGAYSRYLDEDNIYSNEMKSRYTKINLEKSGKPVSRGAERTIVGEHPKVYKDDTANFSDSSSIQTDFMLGDLEGNVTFHTEISNTETLAESGIKAAKIMLNQLSSISGQLDI